MAILRQAEKPLLRLKTLDDLVAGFKPAVRAVRPKLVLIDVLRVANRVPLLASPQSPKSARTRAMVEATWLEKSSMKLTLTLTLP